MVDLDYKPYRLLKKLNSDKLFRHLPASAALDVLIDARYVDIEYGEQDDDGYSSATGRYKISKRGIEYAGNRHVNDRRWFLNWIVHAIAVVIAIAALIVSLST
jgi:hypothetical protein